MNKILKQIERSPLFRYIKYFMICYVGITGVHLMTGEGGQPTFGEIGYIIKISVYAGFFAYGVISFVQDLQRGGFIEIIKRIRKTFTR